MFIYGILVSLYPPQYYARIRLIYDTRVRKYCWRKSLGYRCFTSVTVFIFLQKEAFEFKQCIQKEEVKTRICTSLFTSCLILNIETKFFLIVLVRKGGGVLALSQLLLLHS